MSLAFAPFGREVRITKMNTDEKTTRHLNNLGIIVGSTITSLFDTDGNVFLEVKESRLVLNRVLAQKIIVV